MRCEGDCAIVSDSMKCLQICSWGGWSQQCAKKVWVLSLDTIPPARNGSGGFEQRHPNTMVLQARGKKKPLNL